MLPLSSPSGPLSNELISISLLPLIKIGVNLCSCVIYFPTDLHSWQCGSAEKNNTSEYAAFADNDNTEVEFCLFGSSQEGEHNGVRFVEISITSVTQ